MTEDVYKLIYFLDRFDKLHVTIRKGFNSKDRIRSRTYGDCRIFDISEELTMNEGIELAKKEGMKIED